MRAARIVEKGRVELADVPEPEPGPGEALLRVLQCGICGSDLHVYRGEWKVGSKIGHELCAVVERTGEGVSRPRPGARVCAECFSHCGRCRFCRRGDYNLCEHVSWLPEPHYSGMAQKAVMPAQTLYEAPASFSDADVMMVEPAAVALRAVTRTALVEGEHIGIVGAGTIGLLCVAAARAVGAGRIVAVARHAHQAAAARELGADDTVTLGKRDPAEVMAGLDCAIDTVALGTSFSTALKALRNGGRLVVAAGVTKPVLAALGPLVDGERLITGSQCYAATNGKPDFVRAMELIEGGAVPSERLVTHTLPLDRADEAFAIANDKSTGSIKVAVRMAD